MKFIKEHTCEVLETTDLVSVEQYEVAKDEKYWFLNTDMKLNAILYCPYCGKSLDKRRISDGKKC